MPILRKWNSRRIQKIWKHLVAVRREDVRGEERKGEGRDASPRSILKYGRNFLREFESKKLADGKIKAILSAGSHESPVYISFVNYEKNHPVQAALAKMGFTKNSVVIESIQGAGGKPQTTRLNELLNEPWPNAMIRTVEEHARKHGFKKIILREPNNMYWYHNPFTGHEPSSALHEEKADKIRMQIKGFYAQVAKKNGFRKNADGDFEKDL